VTDAAFVAEPTVVLDRVGVELGRKVALSELSCSVGPGVTGLLGPNGAGKTTLMRVVTGLVRPTTGTVTVHGRDPRNDREARRRLAWVPERDAVPAGLTARQLVAYSADLHGRGSTAGVETALRDVDLLDVADRRLGTFSKGMRQRAKVASALVTGADVLVLDEPLNGADPVQRVRLIRLLRGLGAEGRTVLISSHVLPEVQRLADRVLVLVSGRLAAAGEHHAIRAALEDRPQRVLVATDEPRRLAGALVGLPCVLGLQVDAEQLVVTTGRALELAMALAPAASAAQVRLHEVRPLDADLETMFREVVR
jgi:ABC-2 type transport system ATP-binding protein